METRTISLPAELCRALESRFVGDQFRQLDDFVRFVMQEMLNDAGYQLDESESQIIEQRLRDLGYMD